MGRISRFRFGAESGPHCHTGAGYLVYVAALGGILLVGWFVVKIDHAGSAKNEAADSVGVGRPYFPGHACLWSLP